MKEVYLFISSSTVLMVFIFRKKCRFKCVPWKTNENFVHVDKFMALSYVTKGYT